MQQAAVTRPSFRPPASTDHRAVRTSLSASVCSLTPSQLSSQLSQPLMCPTEPYKCTVPQQLTWGHTTTTTTTTILWLSGLCPGQPGWAGTRRNIHPLTPIVVINHPSSASSIFYSPRHPPCSIYVPNSFFHNHSPSFLWSTSWPGTLHFMLHTCLHTIIVHFCSTCPYHSNLFCCSTKITSSNPGLSSLKPLLGTLSCSLMPYIHLTILICPCWS